MACVRLRLRVRRAGDATRHEAHDDGRQIIKGIPNVRSGADGRLMVELGGDHLSYGLRRHLD